MTRFTVWVLTFIQLALTIRFLRRVLATVTAETIPAMTRPGQEGSVSVIVPVLNEAERLGPCLSGLSSQGSAVDEILVVDGGSSDATPGLVRHWSAVDKRIRLIESGPVPDDWNGKAWGLETGLREISSRCEWVLTVDADVRCQADAVARVVEFSEERDVPVVSLACKQVAPTLGLSLIHPSMLSTLVYRFGVPGHVAKCLDEVQSNGQFGLYRRNVLERAGGFATSRDSICEDVTLARHLFSAGLNVGFYEGEDLAETEMYASGSECLENWPRSLSLRDRIVPYAGVTGLLNIVFLQVIPILLVVVAPPVLRDRTLLMALNRGLFGARLGILVGTRRAYSRARWSYWFSPLFDPVTAAAYTTSLIRRRHAWRGRQLVGGFMD